jgi:hypothetical protein
VEVGACSLGHSCDEQPAVGSGEKQRRPKAEVRDEVAVGAGDALDQPVESQATQVVAHLPLVMALGGRPSSGADDRLPLGLVRLLCQILDVSFNELLDVPGQPPDAPGDDLGP